MAILNIVKYPDSFLNKKSELITDFDKNLNKLINNMFDTMYKFDGVGLAGVQVGVLKKIIVIDLEYENEKFKSEIINPKIISFSSQTSVMAEGCLSVGNNGDELYDVRRPDEVCVEYYTFDKKKHIIEAKGLLAKCLQHEIDHTNGITIVDRGIKVKK